MDEVMNTHMVAEKTVKEGEAKSRCMVVGEMVKVEKVRNTHMVVEAMPKVV